MQQPDYLNLDGKKGNTMGELTQAESPDASSKSKGNYGGVVK